MIRKEPYSSNAVYTDRDSEGNRIEAGWYDAEREVMTTNDKFVVMFADDEPKVLTYIDIVEHINKGWINLEEDIIYELGSKIDVLLDVEFRQVHNSRS